MNKLEAVQTFSAFGLTLNHIHDFFLVLGAFGVALGPHITGTATIFGQENVFRIIEVGEGGVLDILDHSRFEID